ncbi:MAG TPA: hypothetical protein PLS84_07800 [Salinivirgaceae bacterium]|nr:hypothetical protein [Salinivirgaceae bacterium]HRS67992.1 hypothetical protein [Paludibacteraceae bacterium]
METNSAPKEKKKLNIRAIIALVIALAVAILVQNYCGTKPFRKSTNYRANC